MLKKEIPDSEDWSTNTDNPMINGFRDIMKKMNEHIDEPYVGLFFYDKNDNDLFGVVSEHLNNILPAYHEYFDANTKTIRQFHSTIWYKGYKKGKDKRFNQDFRTIPRGKVYEVGGKGYMVLVGSWINDYPMAKDLIIDEFQLPPDKTEFKIDNFYNILGGNKNNE